MSENSPDQAPPPLYLTFSGLIDHSNGGKIFNALAGAVRAKANVVHLLLQSVGGFVGDGIALYNFLRGLPLEIITYNAGNISSIAVLPFLVGKKRIASKYSTFMIHKTQRQVGGLNVTGAQLRSFAEASELDDRITEDILRNCLRLPAELWERHKRDDLTFDAQMAVDFGIALEIRYGNSHRVARRGKLLPGIG